MFVGCGMFVGLWDDVCGMCGFFRHDRRTAPKFGTHVRIVCKNSLITKLYNKFSYIQFMEMLTSAESF